VRVRASNARPTETGVDRGVDVDFVLTIDGATLNGEVTLLPAEDGSLVYRAWGSCPDHWLDGRTVTALRDLPNDEYRTVLDAIEDATSKEAGAVQS
jgi:hypothetical protein